MKIVFPICHLDLDRLNFLLDNIYYFDKKIDAPVVLIYKQINSFVLNREKLNSIIEKIKLIFGNCDFFTFKEKIKLKWELSVSNTFVNVLKYLEKSKNNYPFYFFEADNTIVKNKWYSKIASEYYSLKEPYSCLGVIATINKAYIEKYGEKTLVGGAIYPKDISKYIEYFIKQNFEDPNIENYFKGPFDLCISKDILKISKSSKHIDSRWNCGSFCMKENKIFFKKKNIEQQFEVVSDLYVFHGCKDDSLIKISQQQNIASSRPI
jgi:hypothetical protein